MLKFRWFGAAVFWCLEATSWVLLEIQPGGPGHISRSLPSLLTRLSKELSVLLCRQGLLPCEWNPAAPICLCCLCTDL